MPPKPHAELRGERFMIDIYLRELNGAWFGLACSEGKIAAATLGSQKQKALASLLRSLPLNSKFNIHEKLPSFADETIMILERLHKGIQEPLDLPLASEYLSEPRATVLKVASQIPVGYVTSYGAIAKIAGTEPKTVGGIMASNPLYPIVPCHRVVGTDFSLVGYGGSKSPSALKAKLARLNSECRGFRSSKGILVGGALLQVHPVERVAEKARKQGLMPPKNMQRTLASY